MMKLRAPVVLLSVLLPQLSMADGVAEWVKQRVAEQRASWAAESEGAQGPLFRERRPEDPALPDFVPPTSMAPLVRAVRGGVVNISASKAVGARAKALGGTGGRSLGSGFIISSDGYVVTNNHVVEKAALIRVTLSDGREFEAEVIGRDSSTDVALLRLIGGQVENLPSLYLGDSDRLEVGDWVLAIGNPFGLDHSVAHGMIAAKERVIGIGLFDDFIQTDALINPGNSGGPLFNMRGEVVGVNTAIVSQGQGIGFSVPINMVKELLPNLRTNGRLARGWLGVNIHESASEPGKGAVVREVYKGSPAALAGIRPGDRVVAVNGRPIETYLQLLRRIAILAPGSEPKLSVVRGEAQQELAVQLVERPSPEALQALLNAGRVAEVGVVVRELTPELAAQFGHKLTQGVIVAGVEPRSPAEQAGLQAGDVITEVNRRRVQDSQSFRTALELSGQQPALLRFQRGEVVRYVALRPMD